MHIIAACMNVCAKHLHIFPECLRLFWVTVGEATMAIKLFFFNYSTLNSLECHFTKTQYRLLCLLGTGAVKFLDAAMAFYEV